METRHIPLKSGLNIHSKFAGDRSNPPIILLHGWPSSSLLWRNIIPVLAGRFYVIAPDLPGYGQSDKPPNVRYDLPFLKNFILDLVDALGLEKCTLAAHDLGGMAALSFAVQHPDRLDKFIIMNTCPYKSRSFRLRFSLFLLKQPILAKLLLSPFAFKQILKTGIFNHDLLTPGLVDRFRLPWLSNKDSIRAFSATIGVPLNELVEPVEALNSIKLPTLILWGKKDLFFHFSTARRLYQDLENSQLVGVENAAHFCQEEAPGYIARAITAFMSEKPV